ncbi:hypothetical protein SERLA73DRAFT_187670 [Serpula lacrymans var. lacrymans S7.3]|uniref:Uncharacterized protein n=2 Tax=Serpula lacrymans var. lacrymans TaxID=341189 RepID=F8QA49_SERL3|nr:uncharacterized protein SERLADRAFT_477414 [Serpula lacrymans var. lacrymans S7.9]EGN94639.1 hypothetical protein SERLA73DRAFT_187670 [Serpula lacrymans var. lacrymans S7.3]EGO20119.1 hypothetical protein SERLADRAFT_477414 [Serpula lacrymans var. lacrymans S7.9]
MKFRHTSSMCSTCGSINIREIVHVDVTCTSALIVAHLHVDDEGSASYYNEYLYSVKAGEFYADVIEDLIVTTRRLWALWIVPR